MSWVTILWSMAAAAGLTLGGVHLVVWLYDRAALASLAFSAVAFSVAGIAWTELGMMHSTTPDEWARWVQWFHVPNAVVIVGTLAFVRLHLRTGSIWLAGAIVVIRCVVVVANFLRPPNFTFREVSTLLDVPFLGERVAVPGKVVLSSWQWLPTFASLLFAVFVVHAAVLRWRMGQGEERRRALVVGGGVVAFVVLGIALSQLVVLGLVKMPILVTPPFLALLTAMAWDMTRDLLSSRWARRETQTLRDELAHAGRVTAMGQLASAVAHELRQPLGAILRNAEAADMILQKGAPDLNELREIVADIRRDDRRAGEVIARLRELLQRRTVHHDSVSLDALVRETVDLVRPHAAERRVSLECVLPADLPPASGDRVQLSQVLLNLILNGIDAVDSGSSDPRRVVVSAASRGPLLELSVTDSGPGISQKHRSRLFEPFFTTKTDGMGMGLTISRSIIEAHGGRLSVEHPEGVGARFRLELPVAPPGPESLN